MFRQPGSAVVDGVGEGMQGPDFADCMEISYECMQPERMQDARTLAEMGLGPRIVGEMTGWPATLVKKLCDRAGTQFRGGKARTDLEELIKIPLIHSAISVFVQAVEHQATFWGDTRLTSRTFVRATQFAQNSMEDAIGMVPLSGLYSIAVETMKGTIRTTTCRTCRSCYAQVSLASKLTGRTVFDCPFCRLVNLMLPSQRRCVENCVPTSFADLNLRTPIKRYLSRAADSNDVRAVVALAYGAVSQVRR